MRSTTRRTFLQSGLAAGLATVFAPPRRLWAQVTPSEGSRSTTPPVAIASANGQAATRLAVERLVAGADPLDAAIAGVNLVEDDPEDTTVGYGGLPNEEGVVELDSCVMHGPTGRGGGVAALRNIKNPSRVAKVVAFRTDHVLLVGEGALRFARAHGFPEQDLLTDQARRQWLQWKEGLSDRDDWLPPDVYEGIETGARSGGAPGPLRRGLDPLDDRTYGTINCNVLDASGNLAGVTTTSGLAFKIPGRVGDSPILGAGLYVDNAVGACGSTGRGEENLQRLSSYLAVEFMRQGLSPADAGEQVLRRVAELCEPRLRDEQGRPGFGLKFYLLNNKGEYAGVSMWSGAQFAVADAGGSRLEDCVYLYERDQG